MSILHDKTAPIGIFDSGIGGLTVTKRITELLPNESIIYFGDTAHTPWGDKSVSTIQSYSIQICDFLLNHHCKLIVMACHTATSAAYEIIKNHVGNKAMVINVIDPVVQHIGQYHFNKKIGLIGTKQTVRSGTYNKRIATLNQNIELSTLATPLLVPLIEEGFAENTVSEMMVSEYLSHPNLLGIEAIILGCTHYPVIKNYIQNFYQNKVDIIDASELTALTLKKELEINNLLNPGTKLDRTFYVSDHSEFFSAIAKIFFTADVNLELKIL